MKKYIVLVCLLLSLLLIYNQRFIQNPAIADSVRIQLDMEETINVPKSRLNSLTQLHASWWSEAELDGIEQASNLEVLFFEGNEVEDISYLTKLPHLKEIYLADNAISDISALADLELSKLDLSYNDLSDISSLGSVKFKGEDGGLDLSHNNISTLEKLSSAAFEDTFDYFYFSANNNELQVLDGIEALSGITELEAVNNHLRDISVVSQLNDLEYINISNNMVDSLAPLKAIHPETVIAANNNLEKLDGLNIFPNKAYYLDFKGNALTNIGDLEGITEGYINLDNTGITDLSPLMSLQQGEISFKGNIITDHLHQTIKDLTQRGIMIEHDWLPIRELEMKPLLNAEYN
ncbi:leucine-rich repeat domain-containing protein [Rossellomorea vietnamensis]|uniref:Leucine-rich repeat domain-containing protein n=1 Tax=Rossellomorea vietnamensis TaxID=218284 RepID=A0A5D4NWG7_9BACI|nr:leucine-rich repeat domain-containing protein [Rossellomorea vietnamensis]TYS17666.1 leucine-rich repeat domain-containing protein [Rossellomorea vietnamensis]